MSDEKLARKILRSLPKRFDMKVTTIEEAQGIATIKVEELIGSLLTCEIAINERTNKKAKSIAFVTKANSEESQANVDTEESITDALGLLGRQFNKVMKRVDRRKIPNEPNIRFDIHKQQTNLKKTRTDEKNSQPNDVQCHECDGYDHIRPECATILRRPKKGLVVSWSNSDSSEEGDGESAKHVAALTGVCMSDADGEISFDILTATYKDLLIWYEEVCQIIEKQKIINQLQAEKNTQLDKLYEAHNEVTQLNSQMEDLKKRVSQLNSGIDFLDKILREVPSGRAKSVGCDYKALNKHKQNQDTKFLPTKEVFDPYTGNMMPQHLRQHPVTYPSPQTKQHQKPRSNALRYKGRSRP
ncbi:hypothetical protein QL285_026228 [Trifolium repens]|nr:hypothetical protein QL285_026228 [Trifolium repens]